MVSKVADIVENYDMTVSGVKSLATDGDARQRAKKLTSELQEELRAVLCVKNTLGIHAKRQVSFTQILSLILLFLLGSIAGNMVLLQTTVMLFAQEAELHPDATPAQQAIAVY